MRIAIIGAGISGLVAAYKLSPHHDIAVFEANAHLGGHSHTVGVELEGESYSIDTGFIVYNDWTYPNFIELLNELKIETQPTLMGFSVRDEVTGLEYAGQSLNSLFAQRSNLFRPRFHRMLWDIVRFNREATREESWIPSEMTVGEFLGWGQYSKEFSQYQLLPMGAAIWSCPMGKFLEFPIRFIIEFYRNHGLLNLVHRPIWRVICGGSARYVNALVAPFRERVRLSCPVGSILRGENSVFVTTEKGETESFDHVIFACHSDQALRILGNQATNVEREILGEFPYSRNIAVLHTDESVLPVRRRAWASWNFRTRGDREAPACVTYNMNILQGIRSAHTFFFFFFDEYHIDPQRILGRYISEHPVFTIARDAAQARHGELLKANRTSYCGAYWRNGFHEDGVVSALRVVEALGVKSAETARPRSQSTGALV